jgi:hypothetical protein
MARRGSGIISVLISGDASPLNKSVNEATSTLDKFGEKFTTGLKAVAAAGAAAVAGAAVAFGAFAKGGIEAAIATEAAQARLATLLRNTGMATEEQIKGLNAQAAALGKVGVATGSNITVLQSQLATFDLSADAIQKLTPAIVDYVIAEKGAAATADDFQAAANGLAQALQGNFGALSRVGFVLDDTTKEMIANGTEAERAAALVDVLSSTYDGFNEKALQTTQGGLQALKNQFADVQEQVGAALLPSLVMVGQALADRLLPAFERFGAWFEENEAEIRAFVGLVLDRLLWGFNRMVEVIGVLAPHLRSLAGVLTDNMDEGRKVLQRLADIVRTYILPTLQAVFIPVLQGLRTAFVFIRDAVLENSDKFAEFGMKLVPLATFIRDTLAPLVGGVLRIAFEVLGKSISVAIGFFASLLGIIGRVIDKVVELSRRIAESPLGAGIGRVVDAIVGRQFGGQVTAGTPYLVGEAGPELFIPSRSGQIAASGFGGGINITVNGALDAEGTARQVLRVLQDAERRTGVRL